MELKLNQVEALAKMVFGGNPAAVCPLSSGRMTCNTSPSPRKTINSSPPMERKGTSCPSPRILKNS